MSDSSRDELGCSLEPEDVVSISFDSRVWRDSCPTVHLLRTFVDDIVASDPDEKIPLGTEYAEPLEDSRDSVFADHDVAQVYGMVM